MIEDLKILSIESSGAYCGIALSNGINIIAEYIINIPNQHERLLAELINRITKDCSISINDLTAIAISSGPGSFTGLRIGASIAKGICFNDYPKLIPVPTLKAIASSYSHLASQLKIDKILVVNNSHKDLCYFQYFNSFGNELSNVDMKEYTKIVLPNDDKILVCGTSAINFKGEYIIQINETPSPSFINKLAIDLFRKGKFVNPDEYEPNYYLDFVPKVNRS